VRIQEAGKKEKKNLQLVCNLIARFPLGCACYQAIFNEEGKVSDYIIVGMNQCFEALSGLKRENALGKSVTEIFLRFKPQVLERFMQLGNEALSRTEKTAEINVSIFNHPYRISFLCVNEELMLGIYEDIQSPVYRKYFRRAIPREVIARSISERAADPVVSVDHMKSCEIRNRLWAEDNDPLKFFPDTCDLHEQADAVFHDSLTGLYDRRFAMETLKMYLDQKAVLLSIVLGDVNGLKKINDANGYNAGDEVLIKIAWILRERCRGRDIAARWSDDEYLLVLPYTSAEETQLLLNQLREALKEVSDDIGDGSIMTFGYATSSADIRGAEELVREAEKWMYRKKMLVSQSYRGSVLRLLLSTLHEKSPETQEHSNRMADYCRWVAGKLGLSDEAINDLVILAMLHDIGKMGINRKILNKPGPLSVRERREIEQHPEIGYRITRNIPELSQVSQYILAHHERWDGTGYANRLRGEEIPLASRIIAVVDAYDVMTSGRVYRPARNAEEALDELKQCAGTQFDPKIVDIFTELIAEKVLHANSTEIKEKVPGSRADGHSSEENGRPSSEKE